MIKENSKTGNMKRQKIRPSLTDDERQPFGHRNYDDDDSSDQIRLNKRDLSVPRNVLEAQVQEGDTLQAIAIRYNCSVSDIKRLNKIERDLEIHARKTIKVPVNAGNILANHLPTVHKSGQNSPKHNLAASTSASLLQSSQDKLIEAISRLPSTSNVASYIPVEPTINDIILNTKITPNQFHDEAESHIGGDLEEDLLLVPEHDVREPRPIGASIRTDISFSGSDCDMSWICLLILILALCFAIPLIYVIYIAEHHVDSESVTHNGTH